jgi:hypothetical protein
MRRASALTAVVLVLASFAPAFSASATTKRSLDAPETIQGVRCARTAWLTADGRLDGCFLAEEQTVDGRSLPAGTRIGLDAEGHLDTAFLPGTTEIDGHMCRGGGHDFMTRFHPGGALRLCWLANDEEIQGVPCGRSTIPGEIWRGLFGGEKAGVSFHPDGKLASCRSSRGFTLAGRSYEKGTRVELDAAGQPLERMERAAAR